MKPRFWIFSIALLALVGAVMLLVLQPKNQRDQSGQPPSGAVTVTPVKKTNANVPPAPSESGNRNFTLRGQTNQARPDVVAQRQLERMGQAYEAQNVPIDFYGEVVDQDGKPLPKVKIDVYVRHWEATAQGRAIRTQRETDTVGRFDINGMTGDGISLESIEKDGYEPEPCQISFGPTGGDANNPVVFKMWSTNIHEKLITGQKSFDIVPDGRTYTIDFDRGIIGDTADGNLKVSVKYAGYGVSVTRGNQYDWSAEVDVVDGGLLLETNQYASMYSAPIGGYVPSFKFQQEIKGGQHGSTGLKRFYVRFKGDKEYGRIDINLLAPFNDQVPGRIRLSYAINPSGSRVLR